MTYFLENPNVLDKFPHLLELSRFGFMFFYIQKTILSLNLHDLLPPIFQIASLWLIVICNKYIFGLYLSFWQNC